MSRKNDPYKLSVSQANDTLQNVFSACHARPNTIPISTFITEQRVGKAFFRTSMAVCVLFIILTILAPIPFLAASREAHSAKNKFESIYVMSDYVEDSTIYLTMSVDLDWEKCYIVLPNKTQLKPLSYDEGSRIIAFPYSNENTSIYVITPNGSNATIIITPNSN